jgi:uncharacterized protein
MANLLATETSPYLLRHKDNPVHWRPWGPEALAEAERTNKPIYLSIGFSACWPCHVMETESFRDPDIAALLNENFVCILVDRSERPDLDSIYQAAAQAMQSQGGWPLNIFLTPRGEPFGSGNFFPKDDQPAQGLLGFKTILGNVLKTFRENEPQVSQNIDMLRKALTTMWMENRKLDGQLSPFGLEQAARRVCQRMDVFSGGLNGVPKFPNMPIVDMMWRAYLRTGAAQYANAVNIQLQNMSTSGIYDHVGGGYCRFAQDEFWLLPNFEKMLCDNALMIEALATVWQDTRIPMYKTRIEETVAWIQRDMIATGGGFAASTGPEAGGEEGAHIAWSGQDIDTTLGVEDAKVFKQVYDVRDGNTWRGKAILHRLAYPQVDPVVEGRLNGMRQKLLDARFKRPAAKIDDTILADANGMAIRALTVAADALNRIEWQAIAVRAFWFVADKMSDGRKLRHTFSGGRLSAHDFAEDYVSMAWAALTLFETTGDARYFEKAKDWFAELDARFWNPVAGGYSQTPSDGETLFARPRIGIDGFIPATNGLAARLAAQLYFHSGETHYRDRANETLAALTQDALSNVQMHATIYNALDSVLRALQIVIIGDRTSPEVAAMRDVLRRVSLPTKIVQIVTGAEMLPATHPAHGKPKVQGRTTVYLCTSTQCSPPLTDANQVEMALKNRTTSAPIQR